MTKYALRSAPVFSDVEFRAEPDGSTTFEGYAAVFESPSKEIFDPRESSRPFIETIRPGAFARTINNGSRHEFVVDHNDRFLLSATDGRLRLAEDSRGLITQSPWPRTDYADNVRALHESGQPLGMSFTFAAARNKTAQEWDATRTSRRLNEVSLGHVTVLASMVPAYNETTASFRALAYRMETEVDELETLLEAIKEGRELTDDEKAALRSLAADLAPLAIEADETEPAEVTAVIDPALRAKVFAEIEAITAA
jgi:HK97 family phage prohead protease